MREYYYRDLDKLVKFVGAKWVWKNTVGDMKDVQRELEKLRQKSKPQDRLLITYYNHLWEPVLKIASWLGWRRKTGEQNWLDDSDFANLLSLAGWEPVTQQKRFFGLTTWVVARPCPTRRQEYSVSIIVPARNEAGNIAKIVKAIPKFGKRQEVIFVEGGSSDGTWGAVSNLKSQNPNPKIRAYQQKGVGKADAVRLGFDKARGEILMILDADLTVDPRDLVKFYEVIACGRGEFVNGSRMVYPMRKQAMRLLNMLGNKVFSWLFTWILGQRFKDTLCGIKALLKKDYLKIAAHRKFFGEFDPFGDFDLIFGAVKQNLKVVEIPVRYYERSYGTTNISRFTHGWLLLKMTWFAFTKFRAW